MPPAADLAAYSTFIGGLSALVYKIYTIVHNRGLERTELESKASTSDLDKDNRYLVNLGKSVGELNRIIDAQGKHIDNQDLRIAEQADEIIALRGEVATLRRELSQHE